MRKKLLLADDSITIQKVVELTFPSDEFEVVTAGNGRLAVDKAATFLPDVVLCDVIMPQLDGYQVCEALRAMPELQDVPILLLNGAFEPYDAERARAVGALGNVSKPFDPPALVSRVKEILAERASASADRGTQPMSVDALAALQHDDSKTMDVRFPAATVPHEFSYDESETNPVSTVEVPMGVRELAARSLALDAPVFAPPEPEVLTEEAELADFSETLHGPLDASGPSLAESPLPEPPLAEPHLAEPHLAEPHHDEAIEMTPAETVEEMEAIEELDPAALEPVATAMPVEETPFEAPEAPGVEAPGVEPMDFEPPMEFQREDAFESADNLPKTLPPMASPFAAVAPQSAAAFEPEQEFEPHDVAAPVGELETELDIEESPGAVEAAPAAAELSPDAASLEPMAPPAVFEEPEPEAKESVAADVPAAPSLAEPEPELASPAVLPEAFAAPAAPPAPLEEPAIEPALSATDAGAFDGLVGAPEPEAPELEAPTAVPAAAATAIPSAEVAVPVDMVQQIAQRVISQVSERVIREIAWDILPGLAEKLIRAEIERIKARAESERD